MRSYRDGAMVHFTHFKYQFKCFGSDPTEESFPDLLHTEQTFNLIAVGVAFGEKLGRKCTE